MSGIFFIAIILIVGVFIALAMNSQLGSTFYACSTNSSSMSWNHTGLIFDEIDYGTHTHTLLHYLNEPATFTLYNGADTNVSVWIAGEKLKDCIGEASPSTCSFIIPSSMLTGTLNVDYRNASLNGGVLNSSIQFTSIDADCQLADDAYRALKQTSDTNTITVKVSGLVGFLAFGIAFLMIIGLIGRR